MQPHIQMSNEVLKTSSVRGDWCLVFEILHETCIWKPKQSKGWGCRAVVLKHVMAGGCSTSWWLAGRPASAQARGFGVYWRTAAGHAISAHLGSTAGALTHSHAPTSLCCHRSCMYLTHVSYARCLLKGTSIRWCAAPGGGAWAGSSSLLPSLAVPWGHRAALTSPGCISHCPHAWGPGCLCRSQQSFPQVC